MKAPVEDMSLVSTKRNLFLLDAMASSLTGSLVGYLLYRRFSFINNSFFVWSYDKFLINNIEPCMQKACKFKQLNLIGQKN
jgi:hypothetical protein